MESAMKIGCKMLCKVIASSHSGCLTCMSKCGALEIVVDVPNMWTLTNNRRRENK